MRRLFNSYVATASIPVAGSFFSLREASNTVGKSSKQRHQKNKKGNSHDKKTFQHRKDDSKNSTKEKSASQDERKKNVQKSQAHRAQQRPKVTPEQVEEKKKVVEALEKELSQILEGTEEHKGSRVPILRSELDTTVAPSANITQSLTESTGHGSDLEFKPLPDEEQRMTGDDKGEEGGSSSSEEERSAIGAGTVAMATIVGEVCSDITVVSEKEVSFLVRVGGLKSNHTPERSVISSSSQGGQMTILVKARGDKFTVYCQEYLKRGFLVHCLGSLGAPEAGRNVVECGAVGTNISIIHGIASSSSSSL